jgi:STE24 endopeptidase
LTKILDPAIETARYIDGLGAAALQKSADYTLGNHWLMLWGMLVSALVTLIIVRSGILERISSRLQNRGWAFRTWLICSTYFLIATLLSIPWGIYEKWSRETSYGRTTQLLSDYLMQDAIGSLIACILGSLFFLGIYTLIRKAGKFWWIWSGGFVAIVGVVGVLFSPMLIEPIFNDYKPVPNGAIRSALIKMADEAQIPHDRIFTYDGSRQSENFTANVSGIFGSARIAISDIALKKATLDEVKAVTGHEIGHYVLGHVWNQIALLAALALSGFFFANLLFPAFSKAFGNTASIGDPHGLPVLIFIIGLFLLIVEPIQNAVTRAGERAADNYSLRTVNLPDALSAALVKTAEYRYPRPSSLQEALFYTHPSVEWRVRNAMEWKAIQEKKSAP